VLPFRRLRQLLRRAAYRTTSHRPCESCPLGACATGLEAVVLCIDCPALDAQRLRALGLFEGARFGVVDTRSGMVLDVRGSRLALGWEIAAGITVRPTAP
jgi:Fe2+ transport system protein FeoA